MPPLLTTLFLLIAAAATLLACGPAEPTATPRPTNSYPKLATSLQDVVRKYESGELSETLAAALILAHHGPMVLVQVDLSANIDAVDTWMAEQEIAPRHKNAGYAPPHIYAYVKVSLLGSLSQQEGVTLVSAPSDIFSPNTLLTDSTERRVSGASGQTNPAQPKLPLWLKGYPYPRLSSDLERAVYLYENGELTEAEAAAEFDDYQGTAVLVVVNLLADGDTDAVVAWLKSKGITPTHVYKGEEFPDQITTYVPISLLGALSQQPGVHDVYAPLPFQPLIESPTSKAGDSSRVAQSTTGQGVAKREADHPTTLAVSLNRRPTWRNYAGNDNCPQLDPNARPIVKFGQQGFALYNSGAEITAWWERIG